MSDAPQTQIPHEPGESRPRREPDNPEQISAASVEPPKFETNEMPVFDSDAPPVPAPVDETRPADAADAATAEAAAEAAAAQAEPAVPVQATRPAPAISQSAAADPAPTASGPGACPRCGSQDLGSGSIVTYSTKFRPAYYRPGRMSFFRLHNALRPRALLADVQAQVCRSCGMVVMEVDTGQLARIEKRSGDSRSSRRE